MNSEILRLQELTARTADMEHTILRLQELADYRLNLLTKMPNQWVGLTDEEINDCVALDLHTTTRNLEKKLKEKNHD
jgi:hypothetical protein